MKQVKQSAPSQLVVGTRQFGSAFSRRGALAIALALMVSTASGTEPDLLAPERAFGLSARYKDAKTLELQYKIVDGYYLYRSKFKFALEPANTVKLGVAQFSKGKMKQDPNFGWVETYRDSVRILIPIAMLGKSDTPSMMQPFRMKVTSQGCADAGVCYPPTQQQLTFQPGSVAIVLPDSSANMGVLDRPPQSSTAGGQSLSDALRKRN